jgi:hypothetical protein
MPSEGEMQISSVEFAQRINYYTELVASTGEVIQIMVRGEARAGLDKFYSGTTDEVWSSIGVADLQKKFRSLSEPTIVLHYGEPKAIYTPLKPFGKINGGSPLDRYGMVDDPYSWAVMSIRDILEKAYSLAGKMSEGEFEILGDVASSLAEEDPAWVNPTIIRFIEEVKAQHRLFQASLR